MIKKIYLDMDGVLADFNSRYTRLFGKNTKDARDAKEFNPNWDTFVQTQQFETLDWFPGAHQLLSYIHTLPKNIKIEILSSSGGKKYHDEVKQQKLVWLKKQGIHYPANVVSGRRNKAAFATPDSVLIDDTPEVLEFFLQAGGKGILHKNAYDTIEKLKHMVDNN